jgi:hypothetical protein
VTDPRLPVWIGRRRARERRFVTLDDSTSRPNDWFGADLEGKMAEPDDPEQPEEAEAIELTDEQLDQVPGGFDPQPEPPGIPREDLRRRIIGRRTE